jgi:GxxExxY protein
METNFITSQVIGAAIDVHKDLGPGLLESVYEECNFYEFELREIKYKRQQPAVYAEHEEVQLIWRRT